MSPQNVSNSPLPTLTVYPWPDNSDSAALVHVVTIPPQYPVEVAVGDELQTVEDFAMATAALAVLNGGFFDPNNAKTTSFITVDGWLAADPRDNPQLVTNPDLAIYMDKILNRSEFRRYDCGESIRYDITRHQASIPQDCQLHSALGAGPQLLPSNTSLVEGFVDYSDNILIRDPIGTQHRNARSAIGIQQDGTLMWVMVEQLHPNGGMTLAELTDFMAMMDIQKALNLDGGSSSSFYAAWSVEAVDNLAPAHYGRLNQRGQKIQRPIKSVLFMPRQDDEH